MIDIKFLRENPEAVRENIRKKFQNEKLPLVDEVIENDKKAREAQNEADQIRAEKKKISRQIGALMAQGKRDEAMALVTIPVWKSSIRFRKKPRKLFTEIC